MSVRNGLLALLVEGPKHGFQLKKEFEERTGGLGQLNVGQVYTTLQRLERDGLVRSDGLSHPGGAGEDQRPYRLTDDGRHAVEAWFATTRTPAVPERDELVVKLTLAHELELDVQGVIDAQRRESTQALQALTRTKARADESDLARVMAVDAAIASVEAELRWLDLCEARLAQHARRPGRPSSRSGRP